jgi:signal transduction histidine kinase
MNSVHAAMSGLAARLGVRLRLQLPADCGQMLGWRTALEGALANLVDNAVKFSPEGGVVTLRAFQEAEGAAISIADQGPGMSGPIPVKVEGTDSHGMGLAFARAILRRHGGRMTIDDAVPGAIVTAHFPR